jgi:beta-glucosidase
VGTAIHYRAFWPTHPWFPLDNMATSVVNASFNEAFMRTLLDGKYRFLFKGVSIPEAIGTQDFVGLNYYSADLVKFVLQPGSLFNKRYYPPDAVVSESGFIANLPTGFYDALKWSLKFKLPILVTENGIEDSDDHLRPRYLVEHLHQVWRGINFNWPIKGYFHWSLVDNFEWERGWTQRFGLWGLDVETQARMRRPSVDLYAAICKENALSSEMVQKYAPAAYNKLFPG